MSRDSQAFGALDQGTSSTRALRLEASGALTVTHQMRHTVSLPAPGWVEMNPLELHQNLLTCAESLGPVTALGLANQGESCLAWDAQSGTPLSPVLSWQDSRGAEVLDDLRQSGVAEEVKARSHLPLDPYFSASKLAWLLRHNAEVQEAARKGRLRLGTTDAWFLQSLCGRCVTDRATASRTGLLDMQSDEWDAQLCALYGIDPVWLPEITPSIGAFGEMNGLPLTASIVDQQAALFGHGARGPGQMKLTLGTGGFALGVTEASAQEIRAAGLLPTIAWDLGDGPQRAFDGAIRDVGTVVDWITRAELAPDLALFTTAGPRVAAQGLVCLPLFSGLGAPDWRAEARPLILGFHRDTTRHDLARAALEGVGFLAARVLRSAKSLMPEEHAPIPVDGGVARSGHLMQAIADFSGLPLRRVFDEERTAMGVAQLAALGAGHDLPLEPISAAGEVFAPQPLEDAEQTCLNRALALCLTER
ncbi:FGGY family carbohydrate kinase [Arenibacterium sp. LLYu02]|uniref:FGGY family carbohydrate kinase n=1 Tax=Arenibacterium sp. LLYu02 TaxID=3404132 RepID=UPI003B224A51